MVNQPDPRRADYSQPRETVDPGVADATVRSSVTTSRSSGESRYANYVDPAGNQIEVYQDKNLVWASRRSWATNVICFLLGMLEMILALRFFFRLLGASQDNSFIPSLYNLSRLFVAPFNGIFHDQALGTRSVFEFSTLIAILVSALIAWGLVALSRVVFAPNYSAVASRPRPTRSRQRGEIL